MQKKPADQLLISYPTNRVSPGVKTKAREAARAAGLKVWHWVCPSHGLTEFSTAGSGTCRKCISECQAKSKDHRNAAKRLKTAERKKAAMAAQAAAQANLTAQTGASDQQRQAYLAAMAAKA